MREDAYSMRKADDAYWGNARCNHFCGRDEALRRNDDRKSPDEMQTLDGFLTTWVITLPVTR